MRSWLPISRGPPWAPDPSDRGRVSPRSVCCVGPVSPLNSRLRPAPPCTNPAVESIEILQLRSQSYPVETPPEQYSIYRDTLRETEHPGGVPSNDLEMPISSDTRPLPAFENVSRVRCMRFPPTFPVFDNRDGGFWLDSTHLYSWRPRMPCRPMNSEPGSTE